VETADKSGLEWTDAENSQI